MPSACLPLPQIPFLTVRISSLSVSGTLDWPSFFCCRDGVGVICPSSLCFYKFAKLMSRLKFVTFSGVGGYVSPEHPVSMDSIRSGS